MAVTAEARRTRRDATEADDALLELRTEQLLEEVRSARSRDAELVAPLGPPPLCVVPRGFDRGLPAPFDLERARAHQEGKDSLGVPHHWGFFHSMAWIAEHQLGWWPTTWREVAEGWGRQSASLAAAGREAIGWVCYHLFLEQVERAGLGPDAPLPDRRWLEETGKLCHEWADATGRFADGAEYELPFSLGLAARWPEPVRAKFVAIYEAAGSPWGRTEEAALLYIWEQGRQSMAAAAWGKR